MRGGGWNWDRQDPRRCSVASLALTVGEGEGSSEVSFGEWMLYGVPLVVLLLPLTWWFLVRRLERAMLHDRLQNNRLRRIQRPFLLHAFFQATGVAPHGTLIVKQ